MVSLFCQDKLCATCGNIYTPTGRAQRHCKSCIPISRLMNQREYVARNKKGIQDYQRKYKKKSKEENALHLSFINRRSVAKETGLEFSIQESDLVIPNRCPILDTEFQYKTPYAASIDRIDPSKGYVKGNIQIISRKANTMKSDASREELLKFADWIYASFK